LALIARSGCHVNWRQLFFMLFGGILQMASIAFLTACCPKTWEPGSPLRFLDLPSAGADQRYDVLAPCQHQDNCRLRNADGLRLRKGGQCFNKRRGMLQVLVLEAQEATLIRAATVRCVHMLSILSFSAAEHSLPGIVDTHGIARPSTAATLCTASQAKQSSTRA
jgi:hypothetical protein